MWMCRQATSYFFNPQSESAIPRPAQLKQAVLTRRAVGILIRSLHQADDDPNISIGYFFEHQGAEACLDEVVVRR